MAGQLRRLASVVICVAACACTANPPVVTTPPASVPVAGPTASPSAQATASTNATTSSPCFAPPPPTYLPWGTITAPQRLVTKPGVALDRYVGPSIMPGPIGTTRTPLEFAIGRALPKDLNEEVPQVPATQVAGENRPIYRIGDLASGWSARVGRREWTM